MSFARIATFVAALVLAASGHAATIDRMNTTPFGGYTQTYGVGGPLMVFSPASNYQLSDGSSWTAGAGFHPPTWATAASVSSDGTTIRIVFNRPVDGLLFQNTDYNFGEHSAQGQLGVPAFLELVATAGGTSGLISGYTRILSNDATWYGEPRFNYYSAAVGTEVYFEQRITLVDAIFSATLLDGSFSYTAEGLVDFTMTATVPEVPSAALLVAGLGMLLARRRAARLQS